ncbi:histidine phosphatase family protein [bacterium]|nr:histidine phosphatase family protein [bacterium]
MSNVVLIRPGCTDFDEQNRISGDLNLPMNDRGQGQVDEVLAALRESEFGVIYCDPTEPARTTAGSVAEDHGVRVKERDELRNMDHGLWQGLQLEDIKRKFPKVYKQWKDAPETICPPEGEPFPEALARIKKFLKKPLKKETPFAIVASEPLATLIQCVIEGRKPALPTNGGINSEVRVQFLTINEFENCEEGAAPRNGESTNGKAASDKKASNGKASANGSSDSSNPSKANS